MKLLHKLLCKMGFHDWYSVNKWEPSREARIVTKVTFKSICARCDLEIVDVHEFDPVTGAPIEEDK
jgi:hypothetical protein